MRAHGAIAGAGFLDRAVALLEERYGSSWQRDDRSGGRRDGWRRYLWRSDRIRKEDWGWSGGCGLSESSDRRAVQAAEPGERRIAAGGATARVDHRAADRRCR